MKHPVSQRLATRLLALLACSLLTAGCFAAGLKFLEDPGEGDYNVSGKLTVKSPQALDAQLAFSWQDKPAAHYLLTIKQGTARLSKVSGAKTSPLGNPAALSLKAGSTVPFTLQRRQWRLALVVDRKVVLRAYDSSLGDGKVGSAAGGGAWSDLSVQPVGGMDLQDDFVREEGAASVWEPAVGTWEAKTLRDDEYAAREEADKSANAFSYFGSGVPHAVALAGEPFWDRYSLEAAVKPTGRGAAGIVFYYQGPGDYLLLRTTCEADPAPEGDKLQLVLVRDGKQTVLSEKPGGYSPGQFYKLRVQVCEDLVQCWVDDELRLQSECDAYGQGRIGLYAEGKSGVFFDDVSVSEWEYFRDNFGKVVPGKWQTGTSFKQANGVMTHSGGAALCVGGQNWQRYACSVDATLTGAGSAGIAFCYSGPKDYCLLRCTPTKAQLVRVTAKGQQVLAEKPYSGTGKHRLRAGIEDGLLTAAVDDKVRLQAIGGGLTGGAVALSADGKVTFDNLAVTLLAARKSAHVTKEFTVTDKHPEMAAWASTRAPWVPPAEGKDDWWTKGDYFGDTSVHFTVPAVGSKTGTARAVIGGDPDSKSGLALVVAATEKSKKLTLTLSAGDEVLKTADVEVEGDAQIAFARESGLVVVRVNDQPALVVQH